VQLTTARLAWLILSGWKGSGGYSGYSKYDLMGIDPIDYDPVNGYLIYRFSRLRSQPTRPVPILTSTIVVGSGVTPSKC